jgi:hypothetical protein
MILQGIDCAVRWNGDEPKHYFISFGQQIEDEDGEVIKDSFGISDDEIFYYMNAEEVESLMLAIKSDARAFQVEPSWFIDLLEDFSIRA